MVTFKPFVCIICIGSKFFSSNDDSCRAVSPLGDILETFQFDLVDQVFVFGVIKFRFCCVGLLISSLISFISILIVAHNGNNFAPLQVLSVKIRANNSVGSRDLAGFESRADGCVNSISVKTYINNF